MAYDYATGILVGQGIAASHALTHSIDAARSATWTIERTIASMPAETGIPAHVRTDLAKLRELVDRLDAALSAPAADLREAA